MELLERDCLKSYPEQCRYCVRYKPEKPVVQSCIWAMMQRKKNRITDYSILKQKHPDTFTEKAQELFDALHGKSSSSEAYKQQCKEFAPLKEHCATCSLKLKCLTQENV